MPVDSLCYYYYGEWSLGFCCCLVGTVKLRVCVYVCCMFLYALDLCAVCGNTRVPLCEKFVVYVAVCGVVS